MVDDFGLFIVLAAMVIIILVAIVSAIQSYRENLELQKKLLDREILKLKAQQRAWEAIKQKQKQKPRYK